MSNLMRATVADGRGGIDIQDVAVPVAQDGWVVIAPVGTGVCGTDLHLISGDYPHGRFPVIPSHEFAGYVTEVGGVVSGIAEGDRTTGPPATSPSTPSTAPRLRLTVAGTRSPARGSMLDVSSVFYMDKLVACPEAVGVLDIRQSVAENIKALAKALDKSGGEPGRGPRPTAS